MYEDSWYTFVQEPSKRDDAASHTSKHRRRESLLKQTNGNNHIEDPSDPILEIYQGASSLQGPPQATITRRAKSYSDFYEVATKYLKRPIVVQVTKELDIASTSLEDPQIETWHEGIEDELLEASHEEYQLYRDQLALSERHLDSLLEDTNSALGLLATLSESFKSVETETTAFQSQCEDLLAEQKRIRDLANEVGTDLQYYAYLEPLTRRLNTPGASRLIRGDDFLDMLMNLNACIDFMDQHPGYRDASLYKTRYTSLLERALNLVQMSVTSSLRQVTAEVTQQLLTKDNTETAEYILLYGKYETIVSDLSTPVEKLLRTGEFAFVDKAHNVYAPHWHEFHKQIIETYIKNREPVGALVSKKLPKFATEINPEKDFKSFTRRCVSYVFEICHNELTLAEAFFQDGDHWNKDSESAEKIEQNRFSYLNTLSNFLTPYLSNGDLARACNLISWLEATYLTSSDGEYDEDRKRDAQRLTAHVLLEKHLWPLSDGLFLRAAKEMEFFKPAPEDLRFTKDTTKAGTKVPEKPAEQTPENGLRDGEDNQGFVNPGMSNAFPTVKTAVKLLVMYNDRVYDRPRTGDVLYEIIHQATESLQKAATTIKRTSTIMDAQLFLIKNLMLIENLFMTHEIPDSIRSSLEYDFTPIWETIKELQDSKQLFNPLAYFTPLLKGKLLPAVKDHLLDARKELERVLVQQITAFTKHWQSRINVRDPKKRLSSEKASAELDILLQKVFEDETTRAALWKMIRAEDD
ncbi:Sec34-like family-domain-containing protein [Amylocarpus encephaloides]|uniref:Conserved oligomeric Golgi complex subunit 3 n=1 Tax=Amylocarpus encephaloides TaxID=45428 RepID=A0A9P8C1G7_9HELO|nr:Sec34-like family-domain-containing protein [Amylocarpus encephaloides]